MQFMRGIFSFDGDVITNFVAFAEKVLVINRGSTTDCATARLHAIIIITVSAYQRGDESIVISFAVLKARYYKVALLIQSTDVQRITNRDREIEKRIRKRCCFVLEVSKSEIVVKNKVFKTKIYESEIRI